MKKQILRYTFTIIMSVILLAAGITYMFRRDSTFSAAENRYLAGRPKVTLKGLADGSFMDSFELYVKEQLPFRDGLIKLKALTEQAQLKNENNGIVRGYDGYLFEKMVSYDPQLDKNEAAVVNFVKDSNREINVCIIPNSFEILTDKIPRGFPNVSEEEKINEFYDKLNMNENVHTINMYDALRPHKDEYIYYRTDHHWTTQGAYYGYLELCKESGSEPVPMDELEGLRKDREGFYGTYYSKYRGAGIGDDVLTYYDIKVNSYKAGKSAHASMYDVDKLDTYDKYAMFMHGNEGLSLVDCTGGSEEKKDELLIFKDSYSNCLIPFFTFNYNDITVVDLRYYPDSVSDLLVDHPDADILLIYNFMHFSEDNHFYRLTS